MPPAQYIIRAAWHCVVSAFSFSITPFGFLRHAMRVPPRLGQLTQLFSVKPVAIFTHKNILASLRCHKDQCDPRPALPSPTGTSSDVDPKSDAETVPDDRTLVESRRHSSHCDEAEAEADLISLSDVPADEACAKPQYASCPRRPPTSSEAPNRSARLSIIYPIPSTENLRAHGPTTPTAGIDASDASDAPPLCAPLTPPPTHYKRRRPRVVSNEDHGPDPDQTSIRLVSSLRFAVMSVLMAPTCRLDINTETNLRFPF
jgi:hypothetical protein